MVRLTFHASVSLAYRRSKNNGGGGLKKSSLPLLVLTLATSSNRLHCNPFLTSVAPLGVTRIAVDFVACNHWWSPVYSSIDYKLSTFPAASAPQHHSNS
ncbi:hypothetical protein AZE42_13614 [Rhizopogon vesiculosus]|uniref:Uncharacterized protein n=1 Tax=Rhizopogon vesiculosus TaxID=180088 RepID=A0A1J8PUU7_9AGAM|nr:hypothetical protein AZE42_13614 [Rhizopogon vesiculosus]